MKILIVDDSKINQVIAKDTLMKHDILAEVFFADDGQEALNFVYENDVDLLLLDIVMPRKTGIDVLQYMRDYPLTTTPDVIMLTSVSDNETLLKCFELGANDYIRKPFDDIEFIARVKVSLRNIRQKHQIKKNTQMILDKNIQLHEANKKIKDAQFYMVQKEKLVAIGELAAGVAHEINNPLAFVMSNFNNIKNYAEDLEQFFKWLTAYKKNFEAFHQDAIHEKWKVFDLDFILEDLPDLVEESSKGLERMAKIVTSMRNFSRLSEDDRFEMVDINSVIEEVLMVTNNQIKYVAEVERHLGDCPLIFCNKGEVEQVLVNMFVNASHAIKEMEFMDLGQIFVETKFDEDFLIVEISDNGIGMDETTLSKIFDPFFTTKPVGTGTGLGLSITHNIIVEKHKGKIEVKSEKRMGTTFTIFLPRNNTTS